MENTNKLKGIEPLVMFEKVWNSKKKLLFILCIGWVVGMIISWSIPTAYTTIVKIVPDKSTIENSNFISDIVKSRPFLLDFWDFKVTRLNGDSSIMLRDYILKEQKFPWWKGIVDIPSKIRKWKQGEPLYVDTVNLFRLAPEQMTFVSRMSENIKVQMDKRNGVMNLSVVMQDPMISAVIANEIFKDMQELVREKKTYKANADVQFYEQLLLKTRANYESKQRELEDYIASHEKKKSTISALEEAFLKQEFESMYKPYVSMMEEVDKAKMKAQEESPTFAVIEPASVPTYPSEPRSLLIIFGSIFFFGFCGVIGLLLKGMFR